MPINKTKTPNKPKNDKQKKPSQTMLGGKKNKIIMHPKIVKMTSYGKIIESNTAVISYGRANPPSIGHARLVQEASEIAEQHNAHSMFFMSPTNNLRNPLTDTQKLEYVSEAFSEYIDVRPEMFSNPIHLLQSLTGVYENLIWVTGSDQFDDYKRIAEQYNGIDFNFKNIEVVSINRIGSTLEENISATQMRQAVTDNDFITFKEGLPPQLHTKANIIFEQVRTGLELHTKVQSPLVNTVRDVFRNV